jgi:flagellar motor component MotA
MIGPFLLFISAAVLLMQSENISSTIGQVTALIIAIGGIVAAVMEYFGRKKEAAEVKRYTSLFGQKTVENIPRIQKLYEIFKRTGQIPADMVGEIESKAKEVEEAARVGNEQLEVIEGALKPNEKADSLVIPRESRATKPIPKDPAATPHITPKSVTTKKTAREKKYP